MNFHEYQAKELFAQYGITPKFPEYEKSGYVAQHDAGRGRVWILTAQKKLTPVFVRTGVSDGKYTEVRGLDLKPGEQIVMGATSTADAADQSHNVLAGGGQPRMMGGFR